MNEEEQILTDKIEKLFGFTSEFLQSSKRITEAGNQQIFILDLFAGAVNNRAISLINGFVLLAKENNYLCANPLIRMQLDNALRFFASTLVENSNDFFSHYSHGKPIKDYKDIEGKKLTDAYLSNKLDVIFPGVRKLYEDTSGHIHLSDHHLFATTKTGKEGKDRNIEVRIGSYDIYSLYSKIDFVTTMIEVSRLVLIIVEQWKHEKNR